MEKKDVLMTETNFIINKIKTGTEKMWFNSDEAWQRWSNISALRLKIFKFSALYNMDKEFLNLKSLFQMEYIIIN
jgi:hypothetical protein